MKDKEILFLIQKIRDHRVKKKRRKLTVAQMALCRVEQALGELQQKVDLESKAFRDEKQRMIKSLKENRSKIDAFLAIQKRESIHHKFLRASSENKSVIQDDFYEKRKVREQAFSEVCEVEKSLMKIEEFIKTSSSD